MTILDDLKAVHATRCGDETCRGCPMCYRATGETVCDRTCEHATEDHFPEYEHLLAEAQAARAEAERTGEPNLTTTQTLVAPPTHRFLLFGGDRWYPKGGCHDLLGTFESVAEAVTFAVKASAEGSPVYVDWWHVWDTVSQLRIIGVNDED